MATEVETTKNDWKIRRRTMFMVLQFCMSVIFYVLYHDLTSQPAATAVNMSFVVILGIVSSYVFGAVWDDANVKKLAGKK